MWYRIGTIKSIVQAAPAGGGRVERVARVGEGDDQLRSANFSDLFVDIGGFDLLGRRLRQQIADLPEKRRVRIHVERLALVGTMPAVDFRLQPVAHREQLTIPWSKIAEDRREPGPAPGGGHS